MWVWMIVIVLPLFWVVNVSLKTNREFFLNPWSLPTFLHFENYSKAMDSFALGRSVLNTLYYVGGGLVLGLAVTTLTTFVLVRLKWKGRKFIWSLIMLSLFLPGINILVPQYTLMLKFGMHNSLTGLVLLNSIGLSAFDLLILGGFMRSLPTELEEAAYIDGAGIWTVFSRIIAPLSTPGIVTIGIFRFLGLYNDFLNPLIYLTNPSKYTMAVSIYYANQLMKFKSDWVTLFAAVVISMIPSIIIYILFQRRVVEGLTMGSLKG
jgi:raffinose/stachyose/melibiose transport system permease protein/N-acetylglucosamine transport system permease protein